VGVNIQQFVTTEFGTKLWMALGRWLPTSAGHAFARTVTGVLARRKDTSLYRTMRANQAGVLGPDVSPEQLDAATRAVLGHAGMTAFDLMHIMAQGEDAVMRAVDFGADFWAHAELIKASGHGVLVCGCHLSNFNLGFLGFALQGFPVQVLSAAMPAAGFGLITEMRNRGVLEETPISAAALRKAIARMRAGGACAIGVDWPIGAASEELVPFFGRPAHLATGYIRMALSADAVILPLACRWSSERGYYTITQPPMTLEVTGDREADVQHNVRRILAVMENWIAETPEQWLMYHPVWPVEKPTSDPEN
jgi:lauroyl/myristoyl acyltransferase